MLAQVPGNWEAATVRGVLRHEGWGAAIGYPGIVIDERGEEVAGFVFCSEELSSHWARLDRFEGEGHVRVLAPVKLGNGTLVQAYVYALIESGVSQGSSDDR